MKQQKTVFEMEFCEFRKFATEYVVDSFLQEGLKGLRSSVETIIAWALHNEVWGGRSTEKK